ncbi:hypothetical protein N6H14_33395 [Paenibacillus sp. CC-CFT747]|nr:hypothetical protein N6H14_33395 [Paenibacillus sp. CC-CFT747]
MKKWAGAAIVIALLLWSGAGVRFDFSLFKDIGNSFRFIRDNWFPFDTEDAGYAVGQMVLTLQIALFSTLIAVGIALPASFFAARNTTPFGGSTTASGRCLIFSGPCRRSSWRLCLSRRSASVRCRRC